jgi:callose synthase
VKLAFANIWNIILPVCYANSRRKYCYYNKYGSLIQEWCFTSYMVAAAIYLTSNAAEVVLFFVPAIRKYIEVSNNKIYKVLA